MVIKTLKNLSVPDQKDCIFTSPDFKSWQSLLSENKTSLVGIKKRNSSKGELLNTTAEYTRRIALSVSHLKNTVNIIVTGHQPNWHHCGIFAKNIITDSFAGQTGGTAVQLVLDHDICNTSMSLLEYDNDGFLRFKTISLEHKQQDIPLEFRSVPSKEQLSKFIDSVSKISKDSFCSDIWCQNLQHVLNNAESCTSTADFVTRLQAQLNQALGLKMFYLPVSLMSETDSFIDFVCSIICDAVRFVRVYNKAISNKRQTYNFKPNQTIRLLKIDDHNKVFELPFWLISQTGKRASLYVSFNDRSLRFGTSDNITGTIDSSEDKKQQLLEILRKNKYVIRPKAVTLTSFVRLHLADWFVHGIGARNYEYITDYLIRDYYRISRLNFSVATATMTLPASVNNQYPNITEADIQRKSEISKEVINYREFFFGLFSRQRLEIIANSNETKYEDSLNCCPTSR